MKSMAKLLAAVCIAAIAAAPAFARVERFRPKDGTGIEGSGGKKLAADLTIPDGLTTNIPVVIACHGFRSSKGGIPGPELTSQLVPHGIATMCFDFNAHGDSEGEFIDMTVPNEIEDAIKIYEYIRARPEFGKIAFAGHSQGGVVAAMTAGRLGTKKISGLVLWAAAAVLKDDAISGHCMIYHCDASNPPAEGIDLGDGRRLGREFILTAQKLPIYETAAKYKGGACVITGGSDVIVPVKYGRRFHGVLVGSSFHLLPEEDHNFSRSYKSSIAIGADYLIRVLSPRGGASAK